MSTETNYMTIKYACEKTGATQDALKHYENEGILIPKRKGSGDHAYRLYGEQEIARIQQIQCFRQLNIGKPEILY